MFSLMHICCGRSDDFRQFCIADICAPSLLPTVGPCCCKMLLLVLRGGKTNDTGRPEYVGLVRSAIIDCCGIYNLGKWLFVRFTVHSEAFPTPGDTNW